MTTAALLRRDPAIRARPDDDHALVTDIASDEWDRLVTEFADPYYEQTQTYRGAPRGEHRVRRLAVARRGRIVAMALALVFQAPIIKRGIAQVKFGPLWRRKGEADDPAHLRFAIAGLVEQLVARERLSLAIIPPPDPRFAGLFADELTAHGFARRDVVGEEHYMVDLTLSETELRASLAQSWRHKLKTAEKAALAIRAETTPATLATFDALCRAMEARKSYSNPLWPSYRHMMERTLGGPVTPSIILVERAGRPIAGAVIGHIGETAYYLFGATNDEGVQHNAGYAMHWWIGRWLRERGGHWYDTGCTVGQAGLLQFKKGFVGKRGVIAPLPGEFTLVRDPVSAVVAKALPAAKALLSRLRR